MDENIPDSSVRRLSAYLRQLERLTAAGAERVSSRQLARRMKVGDAMVVLGAGELGRALLRYPGFAERGFELVAAFDIDPAKAGTKVGPTPVHHLDDLEKVLAECGARLAILAVPPDAAHDLAARLAQAGIEGILNFATAGLETPPGIHVNHVDITAHLEQLSFRTSRTEG